MPREYARLLQEDLNTGIGPAIRPNPGGGLLTGTQIGLHSWAIGQTPVCYDFAGATIADGGVFSQELDLPGLELGDCAVVTIDMDLMGVHMHWEVTEDLITVYLRNLTGASVTLPAGEFSALGFNIRECAIEYEPMEGSFTIDVNGAGPSGGNGAQSTGWTGTPTITGGSGSFTYAWKVWNEYTSEGSPLYTSTDEVANFPPDIDSTCNGETTLVVTDTVTELTLELGPESWDWDCI